MYIYIDTLLLYFIVFKKLIMLLSILIPAYKVETLLPRCLDSIFCQDTSKVEIVIVDDGSPDKTFDVAKSYAEKYANLRVFRKENNGVGAARNFLLEKAIGDYIWFIDSDDYIVKDCLSFILPELNGTLDMVGVSYNNVNLLYFEGSGVDYIKRGYINGYLWTKIIRRGVIDNAHIRFDSKRYSQEDWLFLMQIYPLLKNIKQISLQAYVYCDDNVNSIMRGTHVDNTRRNVIDSRETICKFKSLIYSVETLSYAETYKKWLNFSAAGYLYSLFPIEYSIEDIKNDIKIFREKGVYPIGKTGRRKTDFFLKFANNECIYLSMIKLYRMFM